MNPPRRVEARTGRVRRWWNSWGLALRMARREIRRDRGRSAFVWLMIAVPVATICAIHVVMASDDLSGEERLGLRLGGAQAALTWVGYGFDANSWDGVGTVSGSGAEAETAREALPLPGWGDTLAEQEQAVSRLAGQPALAVTLSAQALGDDGSTLLTLGIETTQPASSPMVRPTGGRLPSGPGEALVTPAGVGAGVPSSGNIRLRGEDGTESTVAIVGTADVRFDDVVGLVTAPDPAASDRYFLLTGAAPVTWADAERFAGYGFETSSRYIAANPPPFAFDPGAAAAGRLFAALLISAGALLEVALVVGPAFAIGAARQRRSLALAASNGAEVRHLRRASLGQAILLGVSAAVAGTVAGTAAGIGVWSLLSADPLAIHGPLEIPVVQLVLTLGLGIVASITAALVAARGLGRLDVVSVLRGGIRPGRVRRGAPLAGALLIGAGLALCWSLAGLLDFNSVWVFVVWCVGALALIGGSLLAVPWLLRVLAGLTGHGPVTSRLALRDVARQRGRATSTVAAIMAGAVLLGVIWTMISSTEADSARHYLASAPHGQATVFADREDTRHGLGRAEAIVTGIEPRLVTARLASVSGWSATEGQDPDALAAVNPGCSGDDLLADEVLPGCAALQTQWSGPRAGILAGTLAELTRAFALDAAQQQALSAGKLLVGTGGTSEPSARWEPAQTRIVDGAVSFVRLDYAAAGSLTTESLPAVEVSSEVIARGASLDLVGALITVDAAAERNWLVGAWGLRIAVPGGQIGAELEGRLAQALKPAGFTLDVERGFVPYPQPVAWGVTATLALLAVVAAAMATVLATAELRPFLGTFAAVGADPRLSRRLASTQAWLLGFLGTGLGAVVGVAIGAPLAMASTSHDNSLEPVLELPWELVGALVAVVPVIAAVVATISVPARPVLVRRSS